MRGIQNLTRPGTQTLVQSAQELADGAAISAQVAFPFACYRPDVHPGLCVIVEPDMYIHVIHESQHQRGGLGADRTGLVIGGNHGMAGAARLAGEAALRIGAGLVSIASRPETVTAITAARINNHTDSQPAKRA